MVSNRIEMTQMHIQKRILHLDDDPAFLRLASIILRKACIQSVGLTNPRPVNRMLQENGLRVVLLDIDLPDIHGLTVLRNIKAMDAGIQVIMCTADVNMDVLRQAVEYGAEDVLFKPRLTPSMLIESVEHALCKVDRLLATIAWLEQFHVVSQ
ncbi:response regulator [Pirellulaceae bacterium SH467]